MIHEKMNTWLSSSHVTNTDKEVIRAYSEKEADDAFFKDIEFGTAGMRGIMGPGTNRINYFTIRKVAYAFGLYLKATFPQSFHRGVVIGHDNRLNAEEYTHLTAKILTQLGIPAFIFPELVPTPLLSYAVRYQHAIGGVMLTASHNPKEHNGFKVYDEHGCQLVPHKIHQVIRQLEALPDALEITLPNVDKPAAIITLNDDVEKTYLQAIHALQLHPELDHASIKIVYSPQHGTGYRLVPTLFSSVGFTLIPVEEQMRIDPNFSATESPNPEEPKAYTLALAYAKKHKADLILVSDPDADRVGIAYLDRQGTYQLLNGNLSGALLADYLFSQKKALHKMPENPVMYDTVVCSPFAKRIAESYGVQVESFLTGFKFIGDRIQFYEENAGPTFVFGYEESYGCLVGPFVRDKDALQALLLYSEMTLFHLSQGRRLDDVIASLFQRFGYHADQQFSIALKGEEGQTLLATLMASIRKTPFQPIGDRKVVLFEDYWHQEKKTFNHHRSTINLPQANVIKITYEDGSTIVIRPSGTEPKCKFYISVVSQHDAHVDDRIADLKNAFFQQYRLNLL